MGITPWSLPVLALCAAFLVAVYLINCLAAEAPKKGTAEWITFYEKPPFAPWRGVLLLTARDLGFAALALAMGFAARGAALCVTGTGQVLSWLPLAAEFLEAGLSAMALFLVARLLSGSVASGLMAAFLLVCDVFHDPFMTLWVLALLWVQYRFLVRDPEDRGWGRTVLMGGALGLCLYLSQLQLLLLGIPFVLLLLLDQLARRESSSFWTLPGRLLAGCCSAAAAFMLLFLFRQAALRTPLPNLLPRLTAFLAEGLHHWQLLFSWSGYFLAELFWQLPCALFALGALVGLAAGAFGRRCAAAWFLLLWIPALLAVSVTTLYSLVAPAAALAGAYLSGRLILRKHDTAAVVGSAVLTAATLAVTVFLYFI